MKILMTGYTLLLDTNIIHEILDDGEHTQIVMKNLKNFKKLAEIISKEKGQDFTCKKCHRGIIFLCIPKHILEETKKLEISPRFRKLYSDESILEKFSNDFMVIPLDVVSPSIVRSKRGDEMDLESGMNELYKVHQKSSPRCMCKKCKGTGESIEQKGDKCINCEGKGKVPLSKNDFRLFMAAVDLTTRYPNWTWVVVTNDRCLKQTLLRQGHTYGEFITYDPKFDKYARN